jgi:SsrA-binding protein
MENSINIVNRKIKFEYEFLDTYISGIQLVGTELKPIRNGKVSLVDSFCFFNNGELYLRNATIQTNNTPYTHEPIRDRKLLLKKIELKRLNSDLKDGLTIIPYRMFINERSKVKVEIILCKGKKIRDKRNTIKNRELEREIKKFL